MTSQDVILGLLMKRSLTGYDMKQLLESVFSYFYNASFGTIYPMLGKMEKDGLITKESVVQEGKPNKNVYTITAAGRERFLAYLNSELQPEELKSDFMVRLYFGGLADREAVDGWIARQIDKAERGLARLEADYARWRSGMNVTQELCIQIGIESATAHLRVLREGRKRLQEEERRS